MVAGVTTADRNGSKYTLFRLPFTPRRSGADAPRASCQCRPVAIVALEAFVFSSVRIAVGGVIDECMVTLPILNISFGGRPKLVKTIRGEDLRDSGVPWRQKQFMFVNILQDYVCN